MYTFTVLCAFASSRCSHATVMMTQDGWTSLVGANICTASYSRSNVGAFGFSIRRNVWIPCLKKRNFTTMADNVTNVKCSDFQKRWLKNGKSVLCTILFNTWCEVLYCNLHLFSKSQYFLIEKTEVFSWIFCEFVCRILKYAGQRYIIHVSF